MSEEGTAAESDVTEDVLTRLAALEAVSTETNEVDDDTPKSVLTFAIQGKTKSTLIEIPQGATLSQAAILAGLNPAQYSFNVKPAGGEFTNVGDPDSYVMGDKEYFIVGGPNIEGGS